MIVISAPPAEGSLAWAKATRGIGLTADQRKLVALHLAERVHTADGNVDCLTGQERRILAEITPGLDVTGRFAQLVAAYSDWRAVEDNVDEWRHRSDVVDTAPMGREEAIEYVADRLVDALNALIVVPTAVSA